MLKRMRTILGEAACIAKEVTVLKPFELDVLMSL